MDGLFFLKEIKMKKKIDVKQALLLFLSIHIMIAWVAQKKSIKTDQHLLIIPSAAKSTVKTSDKQNAAFLGERNLVSPLFFTSIKNNSNNYQ